MNHIKLILVLAVSLSAAWGACAATPTASNTAISSSASARVIVSRDFGQIVLTDKTVEINQKSNVMSALQQATRVETSYAGSFVDGINGLRSEYSGVKSNKLDWFYYVNGLVSNTGARDYPLRDGDIEQWDFHSWSFYQMIPAMIGHFPQPFLSGCRGQVFPILVVYQSGLEKQASDLKSCLIKLGVKGVEIRLSDQLSEAEKDDHNLIIIAGPQNQLISDLNKDWKRLGFFAYFDKDKLVTVDSNGNTQSEYKDNTGVFQATQNPWNPNGIGADENTVWVISGTDETGIKSTVDCLIQKEVDWQFSYGIIVKQSEITKLP